MGPRAIVEMKGERRKSLGYSVNEFINGTAEKYSGEEQRNLKPQWVLRPILGQPADLHPWLFVLCPTEL